jgi:2-dehydropantoate 2-reductase
MRIFVIGAGAMGSTYGGLLRQAGYDVKLLDVLPEHLEAIKRDGLHLDGVSGDLRLEIPAVREPDERAVADVAFVHVNAYDTAAAARTAKQVLKDSSTWNRASRPRSTR